MPNRILIIILAIFYIFSLSINVFAVADFELSQQAISNSGGQIASQDYYFTSSSFGEVFGGAISGGDFQISSGYGNNMGNQTPEPGSKTISVQGSVQDNYQIESVIVNVHGIDYPAQINGNEYSVDVLINEGPNIIFAAAKDKAGNSTITPLITVYLDTSTPLTPVVNTPLSPTYEPTQVISGIKEIGTSIWINGEEKVPADDLSTWSCQISLNEGNNTITISSKDKAGNQSPTVTIYINLDLSAPQMIKVTDDGDYTYDRYNLHASWQVSQTIAPIAEYQYAIYYFEDSQRTYIVNWTSTGMSTEVTHNFGILQLTPNIIYYFEAKAKNAVDRWSDSLSSDGIMVKNKPPEITLINTTNDKNTFIEGDLVEVTIESYDPEMDNYQARYLVDRVVVQDWDYKKTFKWQTNPGDVKTKTITAEVKDDYGDMTSKDISVFLFRKAPTP